MSKQYLFDKGLLESIPVYIDETYDNLDEFKEQTDGGFYFVDTEPQNLGYVLTLGGEFEIKIPTKILNLAYGSKQVFIDIKATCGVIVEGERFLKDSIFKRYDFFKKRYKVKSKDAEYIFCSGEKFFPEEGVEKVCTRLNQRLESNCIINDISQFVNLGNTDYTFFVKESCNFESKIKQITYHKKIKTWTYDFMSLDIYGYYKSKQQRLEERETEEWISQGDHIGLFDTGDFTKEEACDPYESESFRLQIGPPILDLTYYYIPSKKLWRALGVSIDSTLITLSYDEKKSLEEDTAEIFGVKDFDLGNNLYFKLFYKKEKDEDLDKGSFGTFVDEIDLRAIKTESKYEYKEF